MIVTETQFQQSLYRMLQGVEPSTPQLDGKKFVGQWVQLLDKQQGRHLGGSGMAFQ